MTVIAAGILVVLSSYGCTHTARPSPPPPPSVLPEQRVALEAVLKVEPSVSSYSYVHRAWTGYGVFFPVGEVFTAWWDQALRKGFIGVRKDAAIMEQVHSPAVIVSPRIDNVEVKWSWYFLVETRVEFSCRVTTPSGDTLLSVSSTGCGRSRAGWLMNVATGGCAWVICSGRSMNQAMEAALPSLFQRLISSPELRRYAGDKRNPDSPK